MKLSYQYGTWGSEAICFSGPNSNTPLSPKFHTGGNLIGPFGSEVTNRLGCGELSTSAKAGTNSWPHHSRRPQVGLRVPG